MPAPTLPLAAPAAETRPRSPEAIRFEDVSLAFDDKRVLDGISFRLAHGETKALFGVAGSGKSSLRGQIGMVFQESALFDSFTVRENVAFRLIEEGNIPEDEIERRVREALSFVELERTVDMFPSELSGGMRRRVAIARAIITQPEIILYDSPTGGLDPVTSTTIVELIVKQRDVYKTSSLLVTHRLQDAFIMATHCFDRKSNRMLPLASGTRSEVPMTFLILREGKIIFDGDLDELAKSKDEYIREYIS